MKSLDFYKETNSKIRVANMAATRMINSVNAIASKSLSRILTFIIPAIVLAGCDTGNGPTPIAGTPAPDIPPGFCDPINFEDLCSPPSIVNFNGGVTSIINNPDQGALNDTDKVAQMQKFPDDPALLFGGTKLERVANYDFADGESFTMKVWSPRNVAVTFKLEEQGNPNGGVSREINHTGSGAWEELCYSFTGQTAGIPTPVNAITLIFDNGVGGEADTDPDNWTFYYDEITQVASCSSGGGEPAAAAPTPTADAANVISLFSDAYTDIAGIDYNPNWGQATVVTQVDIAGNNTLKYAGLDYQGTDFAGNAQNVTGMSSLHVDFWTADSTALNVSLISSAPAETAYALTVMPNTWVSVDIPLTEFAGVDLADVIQIKFDGNGTIFLDNLYFSIDAGPPTEPVTAAPTPTAAPANVISLFSDAYTDIAGIDYNPNWGQATVVTQVDIAGNNTLKYAGLNYQGTDFAGNAQDVSGMDTLHVDFWTADSTALNVSLISSGPVETAYALTITPGTWVSVDIPLTAFAGVDLTDVIQLKFDGNGTIWLDNLYFESAGPPPTEPVAAAPTPTAAPADVISLFSDAYTDIAGIDYNPNWGQATVVTQVDIAGNNTLKYAGLNYQGTDFAGNPQDVSGMETLHVDFWTADSTALNVSLISTGPVEMAYALTITPYTWVSVDVPLTAFAGVDLADIIQLKFDGNGTIWLDNLYFRTAGGGAGGELAVNGGFESGDLSDWAQFPANAADPNEQTVVMTNPRSGTYAGRIHNTTPGSASIIKQANRMPVSIGQTATVSFSARGSFGVGGVAFAEFFTELAGEGTSSARILGGGPLGLNADANVWTDFSFDIDITADVSGGITLQLTSTTGGDAASFADVYYDDISIVVTD